jgi:hypothetical protein
MAYNVRKYCEDCKEYKRTVQETPDASWVPEGCESHDLSELVIEGVVTSE